LASSPDVLPFPQGVPAVVPTTVDPATVSGPISPDAERRWRRAAGWVTTTEGGPAPWSGWFGRYAPDQECIPPACHLYLNAEYLLWWIKDSRVPALLTTGSDADNIPGALGMRGTRVLLGNGSLDNEERSGGRFTAGYWFDDEQFFGVETTFLFLAKRSVDFGFNSSGANGSPLLTRPFFNINTHSEDVDPVATPGEQAGQIMVSSSSRLIGGEVNARSKLLRYGWYRIDLLGGFRYLELDENLRIAEQLTELPVGMGNRVLLTDGFSTRNWFYGGQLGSVVQLHRGRWVVDLMGKVALGNTAQAINVSGGTIIADPIKGPSRFPVGLLALQTNSGRFSRNEFAVVPEVGVNLSYRFTDHFRAYAGYTFLYNSAVARPGSEIDRVINVTQLPSVRGPGFVSQPLRPAPLFQSTDFWAQGINFGLELRY
jgi:hypothetical protein